MGGNERLREQSFTDPEACNDFLEEEIQPKRHQIIAWKRQVAALMWARIPLN